MQNIGLVLEGGANRGIFTSGVLDFFQENNLYLPYVAAVSVGSCNAMDYAAGQPGRTKECFIPGDRNIPPIHWKHLAAKRTIVNLDMVFDEYPNRLVPFDYEAYFSSPVTCEYVVTNCLSGGPEYFTEKMDRRRLMRIAKASSSLPYMCAEVMLDGIPYLDGGVADPIPVRRAMDRGYKKNIVILTRDKDYFKKPSRAASLAARRVYRNYPELIRQMDKRAARYNKTLKFLEKLEAQGKVLLIRPTKVLAGRTDNNPGHLEAFYRQGYEMAKERADEIHRFLD